jgi:lipoprotein-releasing system permease protein
LVTIVIGVASALLLSTYRRRSEIGIMRAMGASKGFVVMVFLTQGGLIGLVGGLVGAGLAWLALSPFPPPGEIEAGGFPIDVAQGGFGLAVGLTLIGALVASILPARAAAKVDPVSVISQ